MDKESEAGSRPSQRVQLRGMRRVSGVGRMRQSWAICSRTNMEKDVFPPELRGGKEFLKQSRLEAFGNGFRGVQTQNPIVPRLIKIVLRGGLDIARQDARSIFAGDAASGVRGLVVHNQNFGAGQKGFQRST